MTRAWGWVPVLAGLLAFARATWASHGGPDLAEVLGWDPVDEKLFVALQLHDETGRGTRIVYFDFRSATPGRAVPVAWSLQHGADYGRRTLALRSRLRPLPSVPASSVFERRQVIGVDTVTTWMEQLPRYHVRAQRLRYAFDGVLEVHTIRDPAVHAVSVHPIPGRRERLAIVGFIGVPHEGGYECQVPVILPAEAERETLRVEWNPYR